VTLCSISSASGAGFGDDPDRTIGRDTDSLHRVRLKQRNRAERVAELVVSPHG
jgi:hypothetical protein